MGGCYYISTSIRQYLRIPKVPFYAILIASVIPWLVLVSHGKGQVEVMNMLRRGEFGEVEGVVELMPCHSTPWMSHLHRDVQGWFLICQPPIG